MTKPTTQEQEQKPKRTWRFFIKVPINDLDDPRLAKLSDKDARCYHNLELLAGRFYDDGTVPPLDEIVFYLLSTKNEIATSLANLRAAGLGTGDDDHFKLVEFQARQAPIPQATRTALSRQRARENGKSNETLQRRDASVSKRETKRVETRKDKTFLAQNARASGRAHSAAKDKSLNQ